VRSQKETPSAFAIVKLLQRKGDFILINIFVEAGFKDNSGKKLVYLI
jgi:hypothetical protein